MQRILRLQQGLENPQTAIYFCRQVCKTAIRCSDLLIQVDGQAADPVISNKAVNRGALRNRLSLPGTAICMGISLKA